MLIKYILHNR